jgi:ribosomal protein L37AE/L43A
MPAAMAPEVLADPIGVIVDLVVRHEPILDRAAVTDVVEGVAGGRAKRRRLAQALLDKPTVLADGRSPAPRAVADLLIVLCKMGTTRISPPVCAECGKQLRTFQRRGVYWSCAVCGPRREPCAVCGQTRPINIRDRDGRPRCAKCPPDDGHDPADIVVDIVTGVGSVLSADAVFTASPPRAGQRHQLSWALQDRPDLLTGAGAQAPVPSVLRLIDNLCEAGAQTITRPACPRCQRVIHLHRPINGTWLCRNCTAKSRAQPCSRCGTVREAAARDEHGQPLCPHCLITDPANHETCIGCRRGLPVSTRTLDDRSARTAAAFRP